MNERNHEDIPDAARQQRGPQKYLAYFRRSGPGWLQGAITLGGGSLAGALYLGVTVQCRSK